MSPINSVEWFPNHLQPANPSILLRPCQVHTIAGVPFPHRVYAPDRPTRRTDGRTDAMAREGQRVGFISSMWVLEGWLRVKEHVHA